MKQLNLSKSVALFMALLAMPVACAKQDKGTAAPLSAAAGDAYTDEEVVSIANELVEVLEMPKAKQVTVLEKVQRVLADPNFRPGVHERIAARGVTGVVAYRLGEGGAVLTVKSGKAVARLKGQTANESYKLSGADVGAQLAASREWGIGLVLGLPEGEALGGKYRGVQKSATAGAGAGTVTLSPKKGEHELILIGAGSGVSLDVSGATLKLKPAR